MAGYKETPRQKMIAMMYLVLTALLALNVSKEILDAFLVVNESIDVTNEKFSRKIDETYVKFKQQYDLNPEKVGDEWVEAQKARAYSQQMIKYIDSLKFEVISKTERIPLDTAKVLNLHDVKKKDNFDTPTNFFVGPETKKGVAFAMVDSMNSFRQRMLRIIDDDRRPLYDERLGLKTDGKYQNADGKPQNWIRHNFQHTILAADVTIMNKIKAEIYILKKEEGGRHTPFFSNYRPQVYIGTTDVTGSIKLPEGVEMVMPGDNANIELELIKPVAIEKGQRFALREGGLTVGAGVVTEIIE